MAVNFRLLTVGLVIVAALLPSNVAAQTDTPEYYGLDTTGSVRVVFDGSGAVLTRVDYGPFGEQLAAAPGAPNEKYAGLFRDEETGLDYAQARQYSPRTGRFTSVDPVYAGLFEPQRWNRYAYALNSPLTFVDPDGLDPANICPPGSHYCEVVNVKARAPLSVFSIATAIGLAMGMSGSSTLGNNTSPWRSGGTTTTETTTTDTDTGNTPPPTGPPGPPTPPPPAPTPKPKDWKQCWAGHARFSMKAANTSLFDLAGIDGSGWVKHMPGIPQTLGKLGTAAAGITGATARSTGMVTTVQAVKAFATNGGWVANLSPGQVVVSAGVNSLVSGALGFLAYETGATIGAAAYATGQTLAGSCQ